MINNFRKVNEDLLKDWLAFREETELAFLDDEDKKHTVKFDEISEKILGTIPKQNRKFVEKQLELLNSSFLEYIGYWNEKYYRNGFCDGILLMIGCIEIVKILWIFRYFFQIGENFYNIFNLYIKFNSIDTINA